MLYFEILPSELTNIIFSHLKYDDLLEIDEIVTINYEELFRLNYSTYYVGFKTIFKIDKYTRKYKKLWELFYNDFINNKVDQNDILMIYSKIKPHEMHTCTSDVYYSFILNHKYPNQYKYVLMLRSIIKCITDQLCVSVLVLFENMEDMDVDIEKIDNLEDYGFEYVELLGLILLLKDDVSLECKQKIFERVCGIYDSERDDNLDNYNIILESGIKYFGRYVIDTTDYIKNLYIRITGELLHENE